MAAIANAGGAPDRAKLMATMKSFGLVLNLERLGQVLTVDVCEYDGLGWYFNITDEGDGRVKTSSARRRFPLHSKLIRLEFLGYVESMRSKKKVCLFPDLVPDIRTPCESRSVPNCA